ncbi:MAG TPA: amidohydrolase [Actinomycetota bacterium]|nr:amidohydrolase [Actinomycetota bacterium]
MDADVVFVNGSVYTVDAARRWTRAVAVRGGRIVAVGTDDDVRSLIGARTEVHDLRDRMLLPGFQDAHVHPPSGGVEMLQCDMNEAYSLPEYERIAAAYAASHPDEEWILGGGWSMDAFPNGTPDRAPLDRVLPDRPAFLPNRDGHTAWVNSRALEMAGITAETPDPPDGRIERDAQGRPTGALHEGAMTLVRKLTPPTTQEQWEEGLLAAQRYLHSLGITAWQDAIVGGSYETYEAYRALAGRGDLTARVVGALWWDRLRGAEQIAELVDKRERGDVGRFRATSVKIMQDGVVETFTAAVIEPYLDAGGRPTERYGMSFVDPEALKAYVTELDALGFQVHFHALAERAVRECLDALEAARAANGPNDLRHHLAHIQIVHPDDVPRFRRLGAVANAQPLWAMNEGQMRNLTIPFVGSERAGWQYPFASLHRAGATLAMGSDWGVSSPNPMWEIHVAVNRTSFPGYVYADDDEAVEQPFLPDERLDLPTAIAAFTVGSAFVNHLEDVTGSIEPGKLADLVVLDRNPFEHPREEIHRTRPLLTMVEGVPVHVDPSFD